MRALPVRPAASRGFPAPPPEPPAPTAAEPAAPAAAWTLGRAQLSGTSLCFLAYLLLIFVEFTGAANQFSILKVTKLSTILSYGLLLVVLSKTALTDVFANRAARLLFGFLVFTVLSFFWAFIQMYVVDSIRPLIDYLGLMIITAYLLDRKSRMDWFAATFAAVALVLVGQNLAKLTSGGPRVGSFVAPYFMGDGNDFAWWLALALPIAFSLVIGRRALLLRGLGLAGSAACLMGVMGTTSRGAFLGVGGAFIYGWLFVSRKRAVGAVLLAVVAAVAVVMAPAGYFARMNTVKEYDKDNSAQARIQAWTAGFHMALDHPLGVGAGNFPSVNGRYYLPSDENNRVGWGGHRWANAHSIYFKVLGEYGFLGLGMLFATIGWLMRHNSVSRRQIRAHPDGAPFTEYCPAFINMSTIAFAMCGVFLGGVAYPHIFILTGLSIAVQRIIRLEAGPGARVTLPGGAMATPGTSAAALDRAPVGRRA
jgi:probable O-glycosylation ligase (exosortase A-associated)